MTGQPDRNYGFTEGVQKGILAALIFEGEVMKFRKYIQPGYFDNPILQDICRLIQDYMERFKKPIEVDILCEELRHFLGVNKQLPEALYWDMLEAFLFL